MAIQSIQQPLFVENKPTNEYLAYSAIWEYFFQEHNLMLLNSDIDEILHQADKFKETFNGKNNLTTSTDIPY